MVAKTVDIIPTARLESTSLYFRGEHFKLDMLLDAINLPTLTLVCSLSCGEVSHYTRTLGIVNLIHPITIIQLTHSSHTGLDQHQHLQHLQYHGHGTNVVELL